MSRLQKNLPFCSEYAILTIPFKKKFYCRVVAKQNTVLFDSRIWRQKKNSAPDCMKDAPENDASFLAPVSAACVIGIRDAGDTL